MKIKGIKNIKYMAKGHRGLVYSGSYKNKKVVIKIKRPESFAENRIENEGYWLRVVNKKGIGPKLIKSTKDYIVMDYIKGVTFVKYLENTQKESAKNIIKIIKNLLDQCYFLDNTGIDKEEMHHPIKHIIISKNKKPVMIDFERCHKTEKPKNVTQFGVFLIRIKDLLIKFGIIIEPKKMIELLRIYKKNQSKENLDIIKKIRC
jgi:putative serine/threonine protein kinase